MTVEPPPSPMIIGVNQDLAGSAQVDDPLVRTAVLDAMTLWGAQSIRVVYPWALIEPTKGEYDWAALDLLLLDVRAHELSALLMLYWAPEWSSGFIYQNGIPSDGADYGMILGLAGERYGADLAAIEMWHRVDDQNFWAGTQAQYIDMLAAAYPVAHSIAPSTTYLAGAPLYLGMLGNNWFANAYLDPRYRPGTCYDGQALQPYLSPSDLPPDAPASPTSILGIADLQTLRASNGDTSPLWATEFGWGTHENTGSEGDSQKGVTEIQQAEYVPRACEIFFNQFALAAAYAYTAIDVYAPATDNASTSGLLRMDQTPKPVVHALTDVFSTRFDPEPIPPPTEEDFRTLEERVADLEARVTALEAAASP